MAYCKLTVWKSLDACYCELRGSRVQVIDILDVSDVAKSQCQQVKMKKVPNPYKPGLFINVL